MKDIWSLNVDIYILTAPGRIELDKHELALIHDDLLKVVADDHSDGAGVLLAYTHILMVKWGKQKSMYYLQCYLQDYVY